MGWGGGGWGNLHYWSDFQFTMGLKVLTFKNKISAQIARQLFSNYSVER